MVLIATPGTHIIRFGEEGGQCHSESNVCHLELWLKDLNEFRHLAVRDHISELEVTTAYLSSSSGKTLLVMHLNCQPGKVISR